MKVLTLTFALLLSLVSFSQVGYSYKDVKEFYKMTEKTGKYGSYEESTENKSISVTYQTSKGVFKMETAYFNGGLDSLCSMNIIVIEEKGAKEAMGRYIDSKDWVKIDTGVFYSKTQQIICRMKFGSNGDTFVMTKTYFKE